MLQPNDLAPNFSLPDQDDVVHTLGEYKGKWLIVYFYPKDDTPGCTMEACAFRDASAELAPKNVALIGISKDTVTSHKKFGEKYHLSFPILSDPMAETIQAFGAWGPKKFMGREYMGILRTTFLIDPSGKIVKVYQNVNPSEHVPQILKDLETFWELG